MRCSVVCGVTLSLLVINISRLLPQSTPPLTTSETVQAVVHRRPCLQHLACCSVNTGSQAIYRLRIAISAYHTCIRRPIRGVPIGVLLCVWHGKTRMVWLLDGEKFLKICLFVLT